MHRSIKYVEVLNDSEFVELMNKYMKKDRFEELDLMSFSIVYFVRFREDCERKVINHTKNVAELVTSDIEDILGLNVLAIYDEDMVLDMDDLYQVEIRIQSRFNDRGWIFYKGGV